MGGVLSDKNFGILCNKSLFVAFPNLSLSASRLILCVYWQTRSCRPKSKSGLMTGFSKKSDFAANPHPQPPRKISKKQDRAIYPKQKLFIYDRRFRKFIPWQPKKSLKSNILIIGILLVLLVLLGQFLTLNFQNLFQLLILICNIISK